MCPDHPSRAHGACTQGSLSAATRQRPLTSRVRHIHHHFLLSRSLLVFTIARTLATAEARPKQAAAARPEQSSGCTGCHSIAHTERLRARKKVHHVEDSMRVRTHSGSHLVVCTPTPTLPSLRLHPAERHHVPPESTKCVF